MIKVTRGTPGWQGQKEHKGHRATKDRRVNKGRQDPKAIKVTRVIPDR